MPKHTYRITFDIAQQRLIDAGRTVRFEKPELWKGACYKQPIVCLVCDHKWDATVSSVWSGRGCSKCAGNFPLTNKKVDEDLEGRQIKRLGDVVNNNTKIDFECLECGFIWSSLLCNIRSGCGCPRCAGNIPLNNKILDDYLKGRNIERIGDYIGSIIPLECKCLKCGFIWSSKPTDLRSGCGCPNCVYKNQAIVHDFIKNNVDPNVLFQWNIPETKLRTDFRFDDVVVEYNGHQHYQPIKNWGGMKAFKKQQKRDRFVRRYCKKNNIQLIEIDGRKYAGKTLIPYLQECLKPWIVK